MRTPLRRALSLSTGWLADRRIPRSWRRPLFRAYSSIYGVDLTELRLELEEHPSFTAFFCRRLKDGARCFPTDPRVLAAPADGRLQALQAIEQGTIVQAKGRPYRVAELIGGSDAAAAALEGGSAWTIYLSPRDYHRVHAPIDGELVSVRWMTGARYSVAPKELEKRERVLSINERAAIEIATSRGTLWLVMVGALNVGRIRVVGVEPWKAGARRALRCGDELARFEMGSTVVLLAPRNSWRPDDGLALGGKIVMGRPLGVALA